MLKFAYLAIESSSSSSSSRINKLEDAFVRSSCSLSNMYKKKKDNKNRCIKCITLNIKCIKKRITTSNLLDEINKLTKEIVKIRNN